MEEAEIVIDMKFFEPFAGDFSFAALDSFSFSSKPHDKEKEPNSPFPELDTILVESTKKQENNKVNQEILQQIFDISNQEN